MNLAKVLPSDSTNRRDLQELAAGNVEQAQTNKDELERMQRRDRQLRTDAAKRRNKKWGSSRSLPLEASN